MGSELNITENKAILKKKIFDNGKMMLSPEVDSCIFHNMSHTDTEILGMFCDFTNIHGEELKSILLNGYLSRNG